MTVAKQNPTSTSRHGELALPPYAPSWVDRLTSRVDVLPVPAWVFYGLLIVLLLAVSALVQRLGTGGSLRLHPLQVLLAVLVSYYVALMHYLNRTAGQALEGIRGALDVNEAGFQALSHRLSTLPAPTTLRVTLIGGAAYVLLLALSPPFERLAALGAEMAPLDLAWIGALATGTGTTFAYHTVHQLRWVRRIYAYHARVNLFRLGELYALSRLASRTAIGISLPIALYLVLLPGITEQPADLAILSCFALLGAVTFIWPLLGIHRQLEEEKERRHNEHADRFEDALAKLHRGIVNAELQEMPQVHRAMAGLEIEYEALQRVPTWPWAPGTARGVLLGLLLPTGVWILQLVLERLLDL